MNLILFETGETAAPLPRRDPRAAHILDVLRRQVGDRFDAGLINGPRGKATVTAVTGEAVALTFAWDAEPPPPLAPVTVIVGLSRPQTARKVLHAATELGVRALHFVATEKSEPSYARSSLWSSGEWRRHLVDAAQQAFDTRLPEVSHGRPLADVLASLEKNSARLALDNYEAPGAFGECHVIRDTPVALALGPERGWAAGDRAALRAEGFTLVHLGSRVLRTETACVAALALIRAQLGWS